MPHITIKYATSFGSDDINNLVSIVGKKRYRDEAKLEDYKKKTATGNESAFYVTLKCFTSALFDIFV